MQEHIDFTSEELAKNETAIQDLAAFIKSGEAIAMVGAGSSGGLYPTWDGLLDQLEIVAKSVDSAFSAKKNQFLDFADAVKDCIGKDRYDTIIRSIFQPSTPTHHSFHEVFCRLPFRAITTTNYDPVLEHALAVVEGRQVRTLHFEGLAKSEILGFLQSLNFSKRPNKWIVHLHGVYNVPESIILGGKEYSAKYGFELGKNEASFFEQLSEGELSEERLSRLLVKYGYEWTLRRKLLWSLLATRRIAFFGFSMADPYFQKMLEFVKEDLSTYNSETHFLVLRVAPPNVAASKALAIQLKAEYGIQTIFFQDKENLFTGLGTFISDLEERVNGRQTATTHGRTNNTSPSPATGGNATITDKLYDISKKQLSDEN